MQTLTENLIEQGLNDRPLTERQLKRVTGGEPARRYGLVNRALKANELIRVRRGLYVLPPRFRTHAVHPFSLAQAIEPGSYISFETALSYHGWIPERVFVTASAVPGRKSSQLNHPSLGSFAFHPLALQRGHFLELVERRLFENQTALVASPLRALMDFVTLRKIAWSALAWLTDGMRIEQDLLRKITRKQFQMLAPVYKQRRSTQFLSELAKALGRD